MSWPELSARDLIREMAGDELEDGKYYLQKFKLYETRSNYYMVGRDKSKTRWRVLTIDRLEPSELNIWEDSTTYTESECNELLKRISEGNKSTGGLKLIRSCYGIVGFVKFLGPYYMLIITERKEIGSICGHPVYAVTKSEMIALPNPIVQSNITLSQDENRYKKLLCMVDLTKDFFFSYSYHIMRSLQKNLCDNQTGQVLYETMFVWNEFLTREIRDHVQNTLWTVALVYGFFKQEKLSICGKDFKLTLIARRSRHYAGTRYLKRGVNEKGRVANDVETEQIIFEEKPGGIPTQISSVVQNRGSIPLFWSQETSRLNLKPDIVLHRKDTNYEATRLHFENLVNRYGNPIIILNLIKTREKKPRESILRAEFANAIEIINKDLPEENRLRFLHWDLNKRPRSKATQLLSTLAKVTAYALNLTGFFYCQVTPALSLEGALKWPVLLKDDTDELADNNHYHENNSNSVAVNVNELPPTTTTTITTTTNGVADNAGSGSKGDNEVNSNSSVSGGENNEICLETPPKFQKGVLRTNCIDCLDRTNVAQYAYGLAALGHQLSVLGFISYPNIDMDAPLAVDLMSFYETMGDTLALQYGGSAAHNKIFSERRGQWKAAIQSQEFFRTLQRYYSNAYMDADKQNAINLFLGYFQPQQNKPALWELDSDQHHSVKKCSNGFSVEGARLFIKRSLSDGNILQDTNNTHVISCNIHKRLPNSAMSSGLQQVGKAQNFSNPTSEDSACGCDSSRYTPAMPVRKLFAESEHSYFSQHGFDESTTSNFLDLDCLLSFDNSSEQEIFESSIENLSTENVVNGLTVDTSPPLSENESSIKGKATMDIQSSSSDTLDEFSESFVHWVLSGETLCY